MSAFTQYIDRIVNTKSYKETFWAMAAKGFTFFGFYLIQIFLVRSMTVELWGLWSLYLSIFNIIALSSSLGIDTSSRKFIAEYNNTNELRAVIRSAIRVRVIGSLIVIVIVSLAIPVIGYIIKRNDLVPMLYFSLPLILFFGFTEFLKNLFEGLYRLKYNFFISFVEYLIKLVLVILLFNLFHQLYTIISVYTIATLLASLAGMLLLYIHIWKKLPESDQTFNKEIIRYSMPLFLMIVGVYISLEIDTIMLSRMKGDYDTGIYAAAKQIIQYLPHISMILIMGNTQVFAKLDRNNVSQLRKKFRNIILINTMIFIPISLLILFSAEFWMPLIFGKVYILSVLPLKLFVPYLLFISNALCTGAILDYQGLAKKRAVNLVLTIAANILLNLFLIPKYGAAGAALAVSISYLPYMIFNWIEVQKLFKRLEKGAVPVG